MSSEALSPEAQAVLVRDFWRRELLAMTFSHSHLLGLCKYRESNIAALPDALQKPLIAKLRELLDDACREEQSHPGSRIRVMHEVNARLWNFLKPHQAREFNGPPPWSERTCC